MTLPYEVLYREPRLTGDISQQARRELQQRVNGMGQQTVDPGTAIEETREADNGFLLLSGRHGGFSLTKPRTRLVGCPGAVVSRLGSFQDVATVQNIRFVSSNGENNESALCEVLAGATVFFVGCFFQKARGGTGTFVEVSAGAKAHFIGCWFGPSGVTGTVINNGAGAGDVGVIGCHDATGIGFAGITNVFST